MKDSKRSALDFNLQCFGERRLELPRGSGQGASNESSLALSGVGREDPESMAAGPISKASGFASSLRHFPVPYIWTFFSQPLNMKIMGML